MINKSQRNIGGVLLVLLCQVLAACGSSDPRASLSLPETRESAALPRVPFDHWEAINVLDDGAIYVGRDTLVKLESPEELMRALWSIAGDMSKAPVSPDPDEARRGVIPDDAIAIRADRTATYHDVKAIFDDCQLAKVAIWKLLIIVRDGPGSRERALPIQFPREISPHNDYPNGGPRDLASLTVKQRAGDVEIRLWRNWPPREGGPIERFTTSETAQLTRHLRERARTAPSTRTWYLDAPPNAKWEDVARAIDCFVAAGFVELVPRQIAID